MARRRTRRRRSTSTRQRTTYRQPEQEPQSPLAIIPRGGATPPTPDITQPPVPPVTTQVTPLAELEQRRAAITQRYRETLEPTPTAYSPAFAGLGGAQRPSFPGYFPQYDPAQGYTPQRPGGGLGPIVSEMLGGAVPEGERMIPLATEAGDVTMNILRTYGRNAAINTEVGRSLLPGSIRNTVAQLLPWYAWGYDSYQEMLRDLNYTEIPGTGAWVKNDELEPEPIGGGGGYDGGGGGGGGGYGTVVGGGARSYNPSLINWRI